MAADCYHDNNIKEEPVRKLIIIKPVQGLPGVIQSLEVDSKGTREVSEGGEGPRHRPMTGAGEDTGLEPGMTVITGHAQQCHTGKLASPLLPPPSCRKSSPQPGKQADVSQYNYRLSICVSPR